MSEIPDAWPPIAKPVDPNGPTVPMFPLAGVFLYPRQLMQLHIFEPRYRQMIEDSLDSAGRMTIATIKADQNAADEAPEVLEVAGLGEIGRHERLDDGRFVIWLVGLARVRMEEVSSERLYRKARIEPLVEVAPSQDEEARLRPLLIHKLRQLAEDGAKIPEDVSLSVLVDLACQHANAATQSLERIFAETDIAQRAQEILQFLEQDA